MDANAATRSPLVPGAAVPPSPHLDVDRPVAHVQTQELRVWQPVREMGIDQEQPGTIASIPARAWMTMTTVLADHDGGSQLKG